jgi:hypothetical protein
MKPEKRTFYCFVKKTVRTEIGVHPKNVEKRMRKFGPWKKKMVLSYHLGRAHIVLMDLFSDYVYGGGKGF